MPNTTFDDARIGQLTSSLTAANARFARAFPGESSKRQPVHTVYGGAHIFKAGTAAKLGVLAQRTLDAYASDFAELARALELPEHESLPSSAEDVAALAAAFEGGADGPGRLAWRVYNRVQDKLKRDACEDFRIDFEDGYGNRPDAEEDGHAENSAKQAAAGLADGTLPPFLGIRIKPFTEELYRRSFRTLDIFLTTLSEATGGVLPDNFVVTLPKVTHIEQVETLVGLFEVLESNTAIPAGALKCEIMVETTQSIVGEDGVVALPRLVRAAQGRCTGAHFGTYDYTASVSVTAAYQQMDHPTCDFATHAMQVALGATGVWLSDGATVVMPIAPHRAPKEGPGLSDAQLAENRESVHRAWKLAYDNNMHSLTRGIYQGWDLHPGQFVSRYAAIYTFFLESFDAASLRLTNFVNKAAQATLVGDTFDDAATGQGLLNYFLRAINCGAVTEAEVLATGLTMEELHGRSFAAMIHNRSHAAG